MYTFNTNARNIHSKLNCFSMLSCLMFVLLIAYASCQQAKDDDVVATLNDSDYSDADDIEWGNFPIANAPTKAHPVIFYKEDIVSEDYDPNKDNQSASSSKEAKPQPRRKYKDINRRNRLNRTENYRYIKPDKVYFDVYPIEYDKANEDDSKFNDDDLQVEVISLLDAPKSNDQEDGAYAKHQLNKRPKKVARHHRLRRDVANQEQEVKRQQKRAAKYYYRSYKPFYYLTRAQLKHPVKSTLYINVPQPNGIVRPIPARPVETPVKPQSNTNITIGNRIDDITGTTESWNIWGRVQTTAAPKRRRPAPPIIHTADDDYVSHNPQLESAPLTTTFRPPTTTLRSRRTTNRPRTTFRPTTTTTQAPAQAPPSPESLSTSWVTLEKTLAPTPVGIQPCIWAVSSCCKSQAEIQYTCFEYLGCIGDFWDVNPCSPEFYRDALETVNNYFRS